MKEASSPASQGNGGDRWRPGKRRLAGGGWEGGTGRGRDVEPKGLVVESGGLVPGDRNVGSDTGERGPTKPDCWAGAGQEGPHMPV